MPVVLSADDDDDAHLLLKRAFDKTGAKAVLKTVVDGSEVIRYLTGEGEFSDRGLFPLPDLLLLDLKMPKVNGFEVLEYIQKEPQARSFPVVVFSSSDLREDVQRAYSLGCHSYLVKPTDFKKLQRVVSAIQNDFLGGCESGTASERERQENEKGESISVFAVRPVETKPKESPAQAGRLDPYQSPEMFKLLVEQVKDYAIFLLDLEGYVLSWNEGARRLKGYEPAEIIGKHFSTFYTRSDIDAEKPRFELRMAREIGRYEDEGWRMRKDGSRFWANVVITPLIGSDGRLTGYAKVTRDLTQRKLQEESFQRLLESEERFRLLVEQVKDYAIFMLDPRGHVTSWNQGARRLKGYTADEIIGKHFSTFYTQEDLATEKPARELIIAVRDGVYEEEGWRLRKDGTRFWASVVITALWDKRGNLTGFAKVTRDLTQKKKEQEMLRQRTEELEAFAHTLSHDLRAPLRSISSFAHILRSERNDLAPEEQDTYLDKVLSAAQAMETLVSDVLKLSHLSLAPIAEESVSLVDLLREVLGIFEVEISERGAQVEISQNLPPVRANRTLLVQIFSNLIANALKFSKPGQPPRIEIYSGDDLEECTIHVKDHGIGIPKQYQPSIFKLFERGNAGPNHGGTGIGLAIVKKAVERLGGSISLASEEGQGSDFVLTLPCETSSANSPAGSIAEDAAQLIH